MVSSSNASVERVEAMAKRPPATGIRSRTTTSSPLPTSAPGTVAFKEPPMRSIAIRREASADSEAPFVPAKFLDARRNGRRIRMLACKLQAQSAQDDECEQRRFAEIVEAEDRDGFVCAKIRITSIATVKLSNCQ